MRFTLEPFDDIVRRAKLAPSREWMDLYFDLVKQVIEATGLGDTDPRLSLTMPRGDMCLPVNINSRYVLYCNLGPTKCQAGFIYGPEYELDRELQSIVARTYQFTSGRYSKGRMVDPLFLMLKNGRDLARIVDFSNGWLEAAVTEVTRMARSPYRAKHQPVVYRAALDQEFRASVLEAAFTAEIKPAG